MAARPIWLHLPLTPTALPQRDLITITLQKELQSAKEVGGTLFCPVRSPTCRSSAMAARPMLLHLPFTPARARPSSTSSAE